MSTIKKSQKGLTLTELLFATAILVFALCGLLEFYVNCLFLNDSTRNLTLAMSHAQYILEEIKDSDFISLEPAIIGGSWDWDTADISSKNLVLLKNESIDTSVFQSGNPLGIMVSVNWNDRNGRIRQRQLQTLITDS
ncbi:MAG: hypothetical protein PVI33_06065 [Candidatus Omnitrophota bacterium]|jgi:hypothetical protein